MWGFSPDNFHFNNIAAKPSNQNQSTDFDKIQTKVDSMPKEFTEGQQTIYSPPNNNSTFGNIPDNFNFDNIPGLKEAYDLYMGAAKYSDNSGIVPDQAPREIAADYASDAQPIAAQPLPKADKQPLIMPTPDPEIIPTEELVSDLSPTPSVTPPVYQSPPTPRYSASSEDQTSEGTTPNLDNALKDFDPQVQGTDLTTGFFGDTGATAGLPQTEQDSLNEVLSDAKDRYDVKSGASSDKFDNISKASEDLKAAEMDANRNQYMDVLDALRGDNLEAMRMGEVGTNNASNRMMVDAQMRAARDYSNLDSAAALAEENRNFENVAVRETELKSAADELANTIGATQEQTLPAITMAEQLIEQAVDEGNMEIQTAEEKREAIIESARTILNSPSMFAVLSDQMAAEGIQLAGEYSSEKQRIENQISNIKNIPGLLQAVIDNVGADMFAEYKAILGENAAIMYAGQQLGLVDTTPVNPAPNAYAEETLPEASIGLNDEKAAEADDTNPGEDIVDGLLKKGIDVITSNVKL